MSDVARDAVVVLPGIMGSELVDTVTGKTLWGLADLGWYVSAWTFGGALDDLAVTEAERDGAVGRVRATRLLRLPAFAPFLRGVEPYTELLAGLRRVVAHRDAVIEFPYDWRLSVDHNARLLATAAGEHLERWRAHRSGSASAELVLVAHSMGGLVGRYFTEVLGGAADVRATVTLGTPFYGAVKAAAMLNSGRGAPLPMPARRLRRLAATLPGVHDLLPIYRCVEDGDTVRRLTASDVTDLGGDGELAAESFQRRQQLAGRGNLHSLVGVEQPTMQSLRLRDGVVTPQFYTCEPTADGLSRVDRFGDSTVYRDAAAPAGAQPSVLPQCHGSIARTPEAITFVRAVLTPRELGPPLAGGRPLGLDMPDVVVAGEAFTLRVTGAETAAGLGCAVEHAATGATVSRPDLRGMDDTVGAEVVIGAPGVYRVLVKGGGWSAVSDLVMAVVPGDPA